MSKKDKMLNLIECNTNVFMETDSYDVISYKELSKETFNQAKKSFANGAYYEDVVCLISTSIMKKGKSGVLFTTQGLYAKSWGGIFADSYHYDYSEYSLASFNNALNVDINNDGMIELMKYLYAIQEESTTAKVGGRLAAAGLALGALSELFNMFKDDEIDKGNYDIEKALKDLLD